MTYIKLTLGGLGGLVIGSVSSLVFGVTVNMYEFWLITIPLCIIWGFMSSRIGRE